MTETVAAKAVRLLAKARTDVNQGQNALGRALYAMRKDNIAKAMVDTNLAENEMGQSLYALEQLDTALNELLAAAAPATPPAPTPVLAAKTDADWKVMKLGAGGWLTGIDVAKDGTTVVRTDTHGGYKWDGAAWRQLFTAASMPTRDLLGGVYELRIAPSNSDVMYAAITDAVYRTADGGRSWRKTALPSIPFDGNTPRRMDGQKLAIDPANPDVVLLGTQGKGLWLTRDGGANWRKIDAVPAGTGDMTGIVIAGQRALVGTAGAGVFESTDGLATWRGIGGPASVSHGILLADGGYLASDDGTNALWRLSGGQWSKVLADGSQAHALAADPTAPSRVALTTDGGDLRMSGDGGKTWTEFNHGKRIAAANDIPWLKDSGLYLSSGGLAFDPKAPGKLLQSAGVGVWETVPPARIAWDTPIVWSSRSVGIEQLVTNDLVAPAGGNPVAANWDRPLFTMADPNSYPANYSPSGFNMAWSVDYASTDPRSLVAVINYWGKPDQSGFSADGGKTWQPFATIPESARGTAGGSIAASTPQNFVWVPGQNRRPAYTLDGGKTWGDVTLPGVSDYRFLHASVSLNRHIVTADRVTPGVFWIYDANETTPGVYRTADGGVTWAKVFAGQPAPWSYWNAKLAAVPAQAGHLLFSSGPQGSSGPPGALPLMRSADGGKSWQPVPRVKVLHFGFGAPVEADGPAAIYLWGDVDGVRGIWGSPDDGKTWVKLADQPLGRLDTIKVVSGDMARPGRVYVGFGGSGWAYLDGDLRSL